MSRKIVILGVTGSIGRNAVRVVQEHPDELCVSAVAALHSAAECERIAQSLGARAYTGPDAAVQAVEENDADICLVATVGRSGIAPTLAAIGRGMDVALATKEVLVMAGELVMDAARAAGVRILPVDSEHSAIWQCLAGAQDEEVDRIVLTASGGPFLDGPADLSAVTPKQALCHPRWKMGPKVTIDSATMMNKGFEILEARWLFDLPVERIAVVVHPESVVHSLVEFRDGATLAQLSPPDMRVAIQYALCARKRPKSARARLDLAALGALTFRKPDRRRFPCLRLAEAACAAGGLAPAVMAAADERAVSAFLAGEIAFGDIAGFVEECLAATPPGACDSIAAVDAAVAAVAERPWPVRRTVIATAATP